MTKYNITLYREWVMRDSITIEADSIEDARDKAFEMSAHDTIDWEKAKCIHAQDYEINDCDIEETKE
jgi:hypothetical protein